MNAEQQMQDIMKTFGEKVAKARKKKNMSLRELAPLLNMSFGSLGGIERGERNLTLPAILGICEKLEIKCKIEFK